MKRLFFLVALLHSTLYNLEAQVAINEDGTDPDSSAMLDVKSTTKGILIPRMTSTERAAISTPATGLMVFDNTTLSFWYYDGSQWAEIGESTATASTSTPFEVVTDAFGIESTILPDTSVVDETACDFVFGSTQLDGDGNFLHDKRMFFNKNEGAFRAGHADNTEWDNANIGTYSVAFGDDNIASSSYSAAWGTSSTASGVGATAWGSNNTASAYMSTAFGRFNTVTGDYAIVAGYNNVASGDGSMVFGLEGESPSYYETTLGLYPTTYTANSTIGIDNADRLFSIGNGTSTTTRSNALTIYKDGTMNINDAYNMPTADGTNGQVMMTDGAGIVSWGTVANNNQTLSLSGTDLTISSGNTVDLSPILTESPFDTTGGVVVPNTNLVDETSADFVFGSTQLDNDGNTDHYSRMFFDKSQSAFRAGYVDGAQWDIDSIGLYSAAFGTNNIATGGRSAAFGEGNVVSGNRSAVFGEGNTISGARAVAFGQDNTVSGGRSAAFGQGNNISGLRSAAFGQDNIISQNHSVAFGQGNTISGTHSSTWGQSNTASGDRSTAFGGTNAASGNYAVVWGEADTASGNYSTAWGTGSTASGSLSTAWGEGNIASNNRATAWGLDNTASGDRSTAWGDGNAASNTRTTAWGLDNTASGTQATTWGRDNITLGNLATAWGRDNTAPSFGETVLGLFSTTYTANSASAWDADDRLLVVGNGTGTGARSNALTIYKDGTVNINDAYDLPTADGTANQIMTTDGSGTVVWADAANTSNFERSGTVIIPNTSIMDETTDDFVFGSTQLDDDGNTDHDSRLFFDKSLSAFRAGYVEDTEWDENNVGQYSASWGRNNEASNEGSTAWGINCVASGYYGTAWGGGCTASGTYATAFGQGCEATGGWAIAGGSNNEASGFYANAFGIGSVAPSYGETALGSYCTEYTPNTILWDDDDRIFVVGNGGQFSRSDALVILKSGNVGIGVSAPTNYQLELSSNSAAKPSSSAWTVTSDGRLKTDVQPFTNGLDVIEDINPVWFTYNGKAGMPEGERAVGTIAQELQEVAPYMVNTWTYKTEEGTEEEYLSVDYGAMDFVLVNAVQEQQQIIEEQQAEIDRLKAQESEQLARIDALEAQAAETAALEARLESIEKLLNQTAQE